MTAGGAARPRVAAVLLAVVVGACGVSSETSPTRLEDVALPPEAAPAEAGARSPELATVVFFVRDEQLEEATRPVAPSLDAAVRGLLRGPRQTEADGGLRSAIPAGTTLLGATVGDGVATIDLSKDFASVVGPEQIVAIAQLVCTATAIDGIEAVRIAIDGQPIDVARGDGSLSPGVVTRADYPALVPA